ncbi:MAG: hypothetical protein V2A56_06890 [bacterium]
MKSDSEYGIGVYQDDAYLVAALRKDGKARLKVYHPATVRVILGHGSKIKDEVYFDAIRNDGVPLERRPGGGCAVVLDPGNVIVSVVLPVPGLGDTKKWFQRCCEWLAEGLDACGVPSVRVDGISDLVIGDRKIAGTSLHRAKDLLYFSASILVTPRLELLDRYLPHPPREPNYRAKRPHRDFVIGLNEAVGIKDASSFEETLRTTLTIEELLAKGID